jgi:hypothetical protein
VSRLQGGHGLASSIVIEHRTVRYPATGKEGEQISRKPAGLARSPADGSVIVCDKVDALGVTREQSRLFPSTKVGDGKNADKERG